MRWKRRRWGFCVRKTISERYRTSVATAAAASTFPTHLLGFLEDFLTLGKGVRLGGRIGLQGRLPGPCLLRGKSSRTGKS